MKKTKRIWIIFLVIAVILGAGVKFYTDQHNAVASEGSTPTAPQAMAVEITQITPQNIQIWKNFSGHVVAVNHAEIRPQVSGRITEIRFEDGQNVEKDDILIVIDPRPYQAAFNQATAALNVAMTQASLAEKEYKRAKKLIKSEAISQGLFDERANKRSAAVANVAGAKAAVESAQINLDYAYVKAPISGKVSRAEITKGNLIQTGASAPLLTSIVNNERVYVDFEVDERTYLGSIKSKASEKGTKTPVRLVLLDGELEYNGVVDSFDNRINPSSGTIRARAIFENEDKFLLPGMSVSILLGDANNQKKILVSERAIGTDQDRKFVYTVNGDSTAKYREVKIGDSINGQRVILSGLKEGEKIITSGLVRIRPGMLVTPQDSKKTAEQPPLSENHAVSGEE